MSPMILRRMLSFIAGCSLVGMAPFCQFVGATEPAAISFDRDVRPILSDKCFACHGPDANTREADLRLDRREAAIEAGAISPGRPDDSTLIERIFANHPTQVMPPRKSNKSLSDDEKRILRQWIADGAEYQSHWSFVPVAAAVPVPEVSDETNWLASPIDAFVLSALQRERIAPASAASRETWLRRVTFDLTGLPPRLDDLDSFVADQSPGAYERVVDRLLASPAFGERMANDWLDAARYADTFGYQSDRDMHVWPWRDWAIRAFNENLSYDRFIVWQTSGDLLPEPTRDQQLATAFNRLHRQTNEGGSIEEEFRVSYIADRVTTNATAFLGLTFECARCHDHKFDPISQRDFYSFAAFFANIDEHGLYSHYTETAPTPAMLLYEGDQQGRHHELLRQIRDKEAELARLVPTLRVGTDVSTLRVAEEDAGLADKESSLGRRRTEDSGVDAERRGRHSYAERGNERVGMPDPVSRFLFEEVTGSGDFKQIPGKVGEALEFGGDDPYLCRPVPEFGRVTPLTLACWVRPTEHKPRMMVLHQSVAAEDSAYRGLSLVLDSGHPTFSLVHFWPGNALRVRATQAIPAGEWTHLAITYDGSSRARGLAIYVNGVRAELETIRDGLTRETRHRRDWGDLADTPDSLALGARKRDVGFRGGAIDELLVFDRQLTPLEIPPLAGAEVSGTAADRLAHSLLRDDAGYRSVVEELTALRNSENDLVMQVRQIMVLHELSTPRPTHILRRGSYEAPTERVEPATPETIMAFPEGYPRNRLGLARWLTDERNPLVARVTVNRFWQLFFGRGLVATAEDFGSQGQRPTHPELLDWLARRFIDSGWNVKDLCRLIVLSSTYRQSSMPRDLKLRVEDPDNRLLARGPKHRLSGEQLRDNALAVSGLLVGELGGPSVMPYQPAGLWEESGTGKSYRQSRDEGLYRRSLYSFWRRTSPPPSMASFDATTREVCIARRERTATPLQALVLLNDPQFVEAARVLAARLLMEQPAAVATRLHTAFRLLTSRAPSTAESAILQRMYDEQRSHFAQAPEAAREFLSVGDFPRDEHLDLADHAATTAVVAALMSFDECVTKR